MNFIRVNHEEEFIFSMKVAGLIDKKFNIETPGDEIGYIAIFFASNQFMVGEEEDIKIGIIIDMHGRSTASSMVEVVNHLLDTDYVIPCGGA